MITKSRQSWEPGQTVKVGFLSLIVKSAVATPGDYAPDAYILANAAGAQLYKFVPHKGLEKLSLIEAREMLAESSWQAQAAAERAIAKAQADAASVAAINDLLFADWIGGQSVKATA